jgi:hypothetical protein
MRKLLRYLKERIPAANKMVVLKVAKGGDILGQTCQRYVVKRRLSV